MKGCPDHFLFFGFSVHDMKNTWCEFGSFFTIQKKSAIVEVKKLARHTGEDESTTIRHLFQQLSIALMKGNAALLNNRNPGSGGEGDEGMGW